MTTSQHPHHDAVRAGRLRIVGKQRARTLRRRGERVFWSWELNARVWVPPWARYQNRLVDDEFGREYRRWAALDEQAVLAIHGLDMTQGVA